MSETTTPEVGSSDLTDGEPAPRFRLRFCWRCLWLTLLVLASLGAIGWFAAQQIDAARKAQELQFSELVEELDDLRAVNARLDADLKSAEDKLAAARAAALAQPGGDIEALTARAQALPEPDRRALGVALLGEDGRTAIDARRNLARLSPDERAALFSGLPDVAIFKAWFETLNRDARLNWVRRLPGLSEVGPTKIDAPAAPTEPPALKEARANLEKASAEAAEAKAALRDLRTALASEKGAREAAEHASARAAAEIERIRAQLSTAETRAAKAEGEGVADREKTAAAEKAKNYAQKAAEQEERKAAEAEKKAEAAASARTAEAARLEAATAKIASLQTALTGAQTEVDRLSRALEAEKAERVSARLSIQTPEGAIETGPIAKAPKPGAAGAAAQADALAKLTKRLNRSETERTALREQLIAAQKEAVAAKAALAEKAEAAARSAKQAAETAETAGAGAMAPADAQALRNALGDGGQGARRLSARLAFRSGSARLSRASEARVDRFAKTLLTRFGADPNRPWRLIVTGHTDQVPIKTKEFPSNWELSAQRAAAVVRRLVEKGVPPERLYAVGRAEWDPIDPRNARSAFAKNRRIEFDLIEAQATN